MKRDLSDKESELNNRCVMWLKEKQKNLGFTYEELAKNIGKSKKTVSLYMNGDSPIKKDVWEKIDLYIKSLEQYGEYRWRPLLEFGDLLLEMLSELHLNQQWLADKIGKRQTDISNYVNGKTPSTAQTQYEILMCLYKEAKLEYGIPERSDLAAQKLELILYGTEGESGMDSELLGEREYFEEPESYDTLLDYFDSLSEKLQSEIIKHYRAFFEQTEEQIEYGVTVMIASYYERAELMKALMSMSDEERFKMVYELEQEAVMTFPDLNDAEEVSYFAAVADMRTLVTDDEYHTALNSCKAGQRGTKNSDNRDVFEHLVYKHGIMTDTVDELKMKLSFSGYDWYVWSLLLIAKHNNTDIFEDEFDE